MMLAHAVHWHFHNSRSFSLSIPRTHVVDFYCSIRNIIVDKFYYRCMHACDIFLNIYLIWTSRNFIYVSCCVCTYVWGIESEIVSREMRFYVCVFLKLNLSILIVSHSCIRMFDASSSSLSFISLNLLNFALWCDRLIELCPEKSVEFCF